MKIALRTMELYIHNKNSTLRFGKGNKCTLRVQFCFVNCTVCLVTVHCVAVNSSATRSSASDLTLIPLPTAAPK